VRLLGVPFRLIGDREIRRLVAEGLSEGTQLDFKRTLYKFSGSLSQKPSDELNEAFCKDLTAMANAEGGVLVCGVASANGIASAVLGVAAADIDPEKLWASSLLASQVHPRLGSVPMRDVDVDGKRVLLIGIPRSLGRPHGFNTGRGTALQFWKRNNAGNQPMDMSELQAQFAESREWSRQTEELRRERIKKLLATNGPATLSTGTGILMLWIFPLGTPRDLIDLPSLDSGWQTRLYWGGGNPMTARPNAAGWIVTSGVFPKLRRAQLFRAGGGIEVRADLAAFMLRPNATSKGMVLDGQQLEWFIAKSVKRALDWFNIAGIDGPFVVSASLIGVEGVKLEAPAVRTDLSGSYGVDEKEVELSDHVLESADLNGVETMGPLFDQLWQSASWDRSPLWVPPGTCSYSTGLKDITWQMWK
jgi:hypothetical protein